MSNTESTTETEEKRIEAIAELIYELATTEVQDDE